MSSVINFDMILLKRSRSQPTENVNEISNINKSDPSKLYVGLRDESQESMTGSNKRKRKELDHDKTDKRQDLKDLVVLLQTIYADEFFEKDLRKYFELSWRHVDKLETFHQTVYSVAEQYLQNLGTEFRASLNMIEQSYRRGDVENYWSNNEQIIKNLLNNYDQMEQKGNKLQKIVDRFAEVLSQKKEVVGGQLDCSEMNKTLYARKILNDQEIKDFLDRVESDFANNSLFCEKHQDMRANHSKLQQYRYRKDGSTMTWTTVDTNSQQETRIQKENIQKQIQSDKKKKKKKSNKAETVEQNQKFDEVREFEKKIDSDFEQSKLNTKININLSQDWINKIKQKLKQS